MSDHIPVMFEFAEALQNKECTRETLIKLTKYIPYFQGTSEMCKLAMAIDRNKISRETVQKVSSYWIDNRKFYSIAHAVGHCDITDYDLEVRAKVNKYL